MGPQGASKVRQMLCKKDPLVCISRLQTQHGLHKSCQPALHVLKLLGHSALEVHSGVMRLLSRRLQRLLSAGNVPQHRLLSLLEASFQYANVKELRPILVRCMLQLTAVPTKYLSRLAEDVALLEEMPLLLRQQVWSSHPQAWTSKVWPLLLDYAKERPVYPVTLWIPIRWVRAQTRRKRDEQLQHLVKLIGKCQKLYEMTLALLRTAFIQTGHRRYCQLRQDILMVQHEAKHSVAELQARDPCHQYAWSLDVGHRDHKLGPKIVDKLQTYLGAVPADHPVIGDLALLAACPVTQTVILTGLLDELRSMVGPDVVLPRERVSLVLSSQLLEFGERARNILSSQKFTLFSDVVSSCVSSLLPALLELLLIAEAPMVGEAPVLDEQEEGTGGSRGEDISVEESAVIARLSPLLALEANYTVLAFYCVHAAHSAQREWDTTALEGPYGRQLCGIAPLLCSPPAKDSDSVLCGFGQTFLRSLVFELARAQPVQSSTTLQTTSSAAGRQKQPGKQAGEATSKALATALFSCPWSSPSLPSSSSPPPSPLSSLSAVPAPHLLMSARVRSSCLRQCLIPLSKIIGPSAQTAVLELLLLLAVHRAHCGVDDEELQALFADFSKRSSAGSTKDSDKHAPATSIDWPSRLAMRWTQVREQGHDIGIAGIHLPLVC